MSPRAACRLTDLGFVDVYDYVGSKMDWIGEGLPFEGELAARPRLSTLADPGVPTCALDETVGTVSERVGAFGFAVVVSGEARVVVGLVRAESLGPPESRLVRDVMQEGPPTYRPHVTASEMAKRFDDEPEPWVLVTTLSGSLVGVAAAEAIRAAAQND